MNDRQKKDFSPLNVNGFILCLWLVCTAAVQIACGSSPCFYPKSLKTSIEKEFQKSCLGVTDEELAQVEHIQFSPHVEDFSNIKPNRLKRLTRLSSLDFSGNKNITEIPDFVYGLPQIKKIDISSTNISEFDSKLCQLKNLESFIGKNNSYKGNEIPFHTFCLENLKVLDMSNSSIVYIDEYIHYLSKLKELRMAENRLASLPFLIKYMSSLQLVDLRDNKFSENPSVNDVFNCTLYSDSEERQDCQEDLRSALDCEYHYKFNHQRGEPLRKWKTNAGSDDRYFYLLNTHKGERHEVDQAVKCYEDWLASTGGFESFEKTSGFDDTGNYKGRKTKNGPLLEKTINGKTLREWRLQHTVLVEQTNPGWTFRGASLYNTIVYNLRNFTYVNALTGDFCRLKRDWFHTSFGENEYFLPGRREYFPELHLPRNKKDAVKRDKKCIEDKTKPADRA